MTVVGLTLSVLPNLICLFFCVSTDQKWRLTLMGRFARLSVFFLRLKEKQCSFSFEVFNFWDPWSFLKPRYKKCKPYFWWSSVLLWPGALSFCCISQTMCLQMVFLKWLICSLEGSDHSFLSLPELLSSHRISRSDNTVVASCLPCCSKRLASIAWFNCVSWSDCLLLPLELGPVFGILAKCCEHLWWSQANGKESDKLIALPVPFGNQHSGGIPL